MLDDDIGTPGDAALEGGGTPAGDPVAPASERPRFDPASETVEFLGEQVTVADALKRGEGAQKRMRELETGDQELDSLRSWAPDLSSRYHGLSAEDQQTVSGLLFPGDEAGSSAGATSQNQIPSALDGRVRALESRDASHGFEREFDKLSADPNLPFDSDMRLEILTKIRDTNYPNVKAHYMELFGDRVIKERVEAELANQAEGLASNRNVYKPLPKGTKAPTPPADVTKMSKGDFEATVAAELDDIDFTAP